MMFEYLADFRVILVTGPHRSGTTICAEMIARDTRRAMYREEAFGPDNLPAWLALIKRARRAVIQCPSMCGHLREMYGRDDIAVVLMRRDVGDILKSQAKIDLNAHGIFSARYIGELSLYGAGPDENLTEVKYAAWPEQRERLAHPFEVEYDSLAAHPMFVPKERRVNWGSRQTHE